MGGLPRGVTSAVSVADNVALFARAVRNRYGHVDILIHNDGINPMGFCDTLERITWRRIMDHNLKGWRSLRVRSPIRR